jgi:hypothetical protein
MSVGQIISRLTMVKIDLQHMPQCATVAGTALSEAAAMVSSVLDAVSDKSLATDIGKHGPVIAAAYQKTQTAMKPVDETITRFRNVRG